VEGSSRRRNAAVGVVLQAGLGNCGGNRGETGLTVETLALDGADYLTGTSGLDRVVAGQIARLTSTGLDAGRTRAVAGASGTRAERLRHTLTLRHRRVRAALDYRKAYVR
jgi:hypothetical protein